MEGTFKLDIYDNRVCTNIYNCAKDEKYCKSMISKLVFYDRDEILDRHSKSLTDRTYKYTVEDLPKKPFLGPKEKVLKVIPLECNWLAVIFADKKTDEIIKDKVMYISNEGDGYFSTDMESALNGVVPDEIYCKLAEEDPNYVAFLNDKFPKGTRVELIKKLCDISRKPLTELFAALLEKPDITLEEVYSTISKLYKESKSKKDFDSCNSLDFIYMQTAVDFIVKFDEEYNKNKSGSQPGDKE